MNSKLHRQALTLLAIGAILIAVTDTIASPVKQTESCCSIEHLDELPSVYDQLDLHDINIEEVYELNGTATKKLDYKEGLYIVYDVDCWEGEEYPLIQADHIIIPQHMYCSPNYEEYKATKLGYLTIVDENGDQIELPVFKEVF